jgi:hypothetical protein
MATRIIKGRTVLIDDSDVHLLDDLKWRVVKNCGHEYVVRRPRDENGKEVYVPLHRVILAAPPGMVVDHRDGNGLNNQRSNLRLATHAENMRNRKTQSNNLSGYKGATQRPDGKWRGAIAYNGRRYMRDGFPSPAAAHAWYVAKAIELHGEFARFA